MYLWCLRWLFVGSLRLLLFDFHDLYLWKHFASGFWRSLDQLIPLFVFRSWGWWVWPRVSEAQNFKSYFLSELRSSLCFADSVSARAQFFTSLTSLGGKLSTFQVPGVIYHLSLILPTRNFRSEILGHLNVTLILVLRSRALYDILNI